MENRYKFINTEDGSSTIYMHDYDESMHSTSGAYQESVLKHVLPSGILNKKFNPICILDIGFGLGYNILAAIEEFFHFNPQQGLIFVSFEKDTGLLPVMNDIVFNDHRDFIYESIKMAYSGGESVFNNIKIRLIQGDARRSIEGLSNIKFDAVFHDPFSPAKNPELWSVDFFKKVGNIMKDDAILTTYSSAPQVRMGLISAGFNVGKGPSVGRKKEGTIASKKGNIKPLDEDELRIIYDNVKSIPYRDEALDADREKILERRIAEMAEARSKPDRQAGQG